MNRAQKKNIKLDSSFKTITIKKEYNTAKSGLRTVLKDDQELAIRAIWLSSEGLGSKHV
ncbi:hypothetical protein MUP77_23370 [Candidatus Bathyarchaeota archaeon]|nr:hypothetical protein [Candidatus Bathyarchaeota archaeon]